MLPEALDFKTESDALYALMREMDEAGFDAPTQFKGWTLNNVLEHLHMWNWAANESYVDEHNFAAWLSEAMTAIGQSSMRAYEADWNGGVKGRDLLEKWYGFYTDMAARLARCATIKTPFDPSLFWGQIHLVGPMQPAAKRRRGRCHLSN